MSGALVDQGLTYIGVDWGCHVGQDLSRVVLKFRVNFRLEVYVPVKKSRVIQQRVRLVKVSPSKSIQRAKSTLLLLWFLPDLCPFFWDLGER